MSTLLSRYICWRTNHKFNKFVSVIEENWIFRVYSNFLNFELYKWTIKNKDRHLRIVSSDGSDYEILELLDEEDEHIYQCTCFVGRSIFKFYTNTHSHLFLRGKRQLWPEVVSVKLHTTRSVCHRKTQHQKWKAVCQSCWISWRNSQT